MTIICALHDPETRSTWIGADSQTTFGSMAFLHARKWFVSPDGGTAVAISGLTRLADLFRRRLDDAFHNATAESISDLMRQIALDDGWEMEKRPAQSPDIEANGLFATPAAAWIICSDFTVVPTPAGFLATQGNGEYFAIGAAHALAGQPAEVVVRAAVDAAIALSIHSGGEPWIHELTADADRK